MAEKSEKKLTSTIKLYMLITIVRKSKIDYYYDLISGLDANLQMICIGNGTTKSAIFSNEIGTKGVIFSVLKEKDAKKALKLLEEKFKNIRNGKGVSFMVPMDSVMGVNLFNFLSNNKTKFD